MKKLGLIILLGLSQALPSVAQQQQVTLDLQQTIKMANDSSLEAFRTKNMYLSGYWEYRTYKANRLPSLTLNMTPAQYNRDITKRYDSEQDLDIYRSQQSFYAYGNLAVRQNFDLTGGTFYLDTELGYMRSFGSNPYTQYTSVPVRLGYSQSLVARQIPVDAELSIYTNSFPIVNVLMHHPNLELIFLGGKVFPSSQVTVGVSVFQALQTIRPDWLVLGISNVHPHQGLTGPDREEAMMKRLMMERAQKRIILADSHKLNTAEAYSVASLGDIDYLVTEDSKVDYIRQNWPKSSYQVL